MSNLRASDLRPSREIAEMVLDLLVFVLVAAVTLSFRDCEPLNYRDVQMEEVP